MQIVDNVLNGVLIIKTDVYQDNRGNFSEKYNIKKFKDINLTTEWDQDNYSVSKKSVIRGLHYQKNPYSQTKLVTCYYGEILDVMVDLRKDSPTFSKHYKTKLTGENGLMVLIPTGFAHGFSVLSETAGAGYKVKGLFNKESEGSILYSSLGIDWEVGEPIVSEKDMNAKPFSDYLNNPDF